MSEKNLGIIGGGQLQVPLVDEVKKLGYKRKYNLKNIKELIHLKKQIF